MTDIFTRALTYAMPTQRADGTWDAGEVLSDRTVPWGSVKIVLGSTWKPSGDPDLPPEDRVPLLLTEGVDITDVDGRPTRLGQLGRSEPWGPTNLSLIIQRPTPFDQPSWLRGCRKGTAVDIWKVRPDGTRVGFWHGFAQGPQLDDADGMTYTWTIQALGAAYGEASTRKHKPLMRKVLRNAGTLVNYDLAPEQYARPYTGHVGFAFESATLLDADGDEIELRFPGSMGQSEREYVEQVLALAAEPGRQWTISETYGTNGERQPRKFYLRGKSASFDTAIQRSWIWAGGYGVELHLRADYTEHPNRIFGQGVDPTDKYRWRNAKAPGLFGAKPAYPERAEGSTYPITMGDVDADFTAEVITQLQWGLRQGGWPSARPTGEFDVGTATAIIALQTDQGVTVTGEIQSNADWDLVFSSIALESTIDSAYVRPLSEVLEATEWEYAANGGVTGANELYDRRPSVEETIGYDQTEMARARKHARSLTRQAIDEAPWIGTIVLTAGVIDEAGNPRSFLDLYVGGWIRVMGLAGGTHTDFHIADIQYSDNLGSATLMVSETALDALDLVKRWQRIKDARSDPAKSAFSEKYRTTHPIKDLIGWDKELGSGLIPPTHCDASTWTVIPFLGAESATIGAARLKTTGSATEFIFAVFGGGWDDAALTTWLNTNLPEPRIAEPTGDGWFNLRSLYDDYESAGLVEAWGEEGDLAGYSPGKQNDEADDPPPITGVFESTLSWQGWSLNPPDWQLAVFPAAACTITGELRMVPDEG